MNFTFITLAIFSCMCSKVNSSNLYTAPPVPNGCFIKISWEYARKMPIIFTSDDENAKIIDPNYIDYVKIGKKQSVKIACVKTKFQNIQFNSNEILITCVDDDTWLYKHKLYVFINFICADPPKSDLIVTSEKCHAEKYVVAKVGFQTEKHFLYVYSICFNESSKSNVYSWNYMESPIFIPQQNKKMEIFTTTKQFFGEINMHHRYSFSYQVQLMSNILGSKEQAEKYFIENNSSYDSYLSRCTLTPKSDFYFPCQHEATFFYANIAPQWNSINTDIWPSVEKTVRRAIRRSSTARHLVVTGTYGTCTLPNENRIQKPLFLDNKGSIPVPLFFWKLLYNLDEKNGLVYIALNNPFMKIDHDTYICEDACPGEFSEMPGDKKKFVYCCTIESFVKFYGKLDSILFDGEMATKFLSRTPEKVAETPSWTESFSPRV